MPKVTPTEIQKHLALLEETPRRLAACTAKLSDAQLHTAPGPKAWSAAETLAHLRACADVWTHSIYAMLAESAPQLALLDERRWAKATRYAELKFRKSLQAFTLQREELLHVLLSLPLESWTRSATIAGRSHTVFSQARRMALHEAEHCAQIETLTT
ncbi:MAG: DinB family protein [Anaerolineales bacterium]